MPILSVDVQPNGFRFVTGGTDNKVCVWNLLPVVSERYERMGSKSNSSKNAQNNQRKNSNMNEEVKVSANGDVEMKDYHDPTNDKSKDSESDLIDVSISQIYNIIEIYI